MYYYIDSNNCREKHDFVEPFVGTFRYKTTQKYENKTTDESSV